MIRRTFLVAIAAIITTSACALRSTPRPSISGYVFRFGMRFGRRDIRVPNAPVMLSRWVKKDHPDQKLVDRLLVIAKTHTNNYGEYHFHDVAPGWYYVQAIGGPWKMVRVESAPVWANLFQDYQRS